MPRFRSTQPLASPQHLSGIPSADPQRLPSFSLTGSTSGFRAGVHSAICTLGRKWCLATVRLEMSTIRGLFQFMLDTGAADMFFNPVNQVKAAMIAIAAAPILCP